MNSLNFSIQLHQNTASQMVEQEATKLDFLCDMFLINAHFVRNIRSNFMQNSTHNSPSNICKNNAFI